MKAFLAGMVMLLVATGVNAKVNDLDRDVAATLYYAQTCEGAGDLMPQLYELAQRIANSRPSEYMQARDEFQQQLWEGQSTSDHEALEIIWCMLMRDKLRYKGNDQR
jgi:hypothetical protein